MFTAPDAEDVNNKIDPEAVCISNLENPDSSYVRQKIDIEKILDFSEFDVKTKS